LSPLKIFSVSHMPNMSLRNLYQDRKLHYIQDCNLCGACVEACPAIALTALKSVSSCDIQEKVMGVLKDGTLCEEASIRSASCAHCMSCRDACPLDIDPVVMQELLQLEMVRLTGKRRPLMELRLGEDSLFIPDILASMQVSPEEKHWLSSVPDHPGEKDIVIFTGCALVMMPDKIYLVSEIFKRLGLDFALVAGGELCCGARYAGVDLDVAERLAHKLVAALAAFKPEQVIFCCAECAGRIAAFDHEVSPVPFQYEEMFHFLANRVSDIKFIHPIKRNVTLHDPCSMSRLMGDTTSLRTILKAIPGLTQMEMANARDKSLCCGAVASRKLPAVGRAMARQVLEEALKTGAETLVDACQGCHFQFISLQSRYPFQIQNILTVIGEAMGIRSEDRLREFFICGDADRILEECRANIEAGPYDPGLTAMLARHIFSSAG